MVGSTACPLEPTMVSKERLLTSGFAVLYRSVTPLLMDGGPAMNYQASKEFCISDNSWWFTWKHQG